MVAKTPKEKRPAWDDYFMTLCRQVATRSTCLRHDVGAMKHCLEFGCIRDELKIASGTRAEICRAVHAEQNAVIQCAIYSVSSEGSTIYITHQPCTICTKILINAGIRRIVYENAYPDDFSQKLLKEAGVTLEKWQEK